MTIVDGTHVWPHASNSMRAVELPFESGPRSQLALRLKPLERLRVGLRVTLPADAKPGQEYRLDLVQRDGGNQVTGGVALTIRAA